MEQKQTNFNKLPKDLQDKMLKWDANKPANKTVKVLEDLFTLVDEISVLLQGNEKDGKKTVNEQGAILIDIREALQALVSKEYPETPDYAKPIVEAFTKLQNALAKEIDKIDMKPVFSPNIKVDAPKVSVPPASVDLKGIEKMLKVEMPKAFEKAIKLIPKMEMPDEKDYSQIFADVLEKLDNIDTGTRLKNTFPKTIDVPGVATEATLLKLNGFSLPVYDAIVPTFNATSDAWAYKTGGASGTTVATITVSYTDATKAVITNVVRS